MIAGLLTDLPRQKAVLPAAIVRALEVIQKLDAKTLTPGRFEIEGDKLFYLVQDVELRTMKESRVEAHRQYADIQIPCSGGERYGFALPQAGLPITEDLLREKDLAFYQAPKDESFIDTAPGMYLVFMPEELHRPCLALGAKGTLRKIVVKVHSSLLGL